MEAWQHIGPTFARRRSGEAILFATRMGVFAIANRVFELSDSMDDLRELRSFEVAAGEERSGMRGTVLPHEVITTKTYVSLVESAGPTNESPQSIDSC